MEIKKHKTKIMRFVAVVMAAAMLSAAAALSASAESTVRSGSSGGDVQKLQLFLNVSERQSLDADGKFGKLTKAAVISFQSRNGLVADGIAGAKTWAKVNEKISYAVSSGTPAAVNIMSGSLNLRDRASSSSSVVGSLYRGDRVTLLYNTGNYSAVYTGEKCGFVASRYLTSDNTQNTSSDKTSIVISAAKSLIGAPYSIPKAGQAAPNGKIYTDCSYLTQYCFAKAGVYLPRTAAEQARMTDSRGLAISRSALKPGDLIFYSSYANGRYKNITHVALYVGDGYIIDASSSKGQTVYRKIWGSPVMYASASNLL